MADGASEEAEFREVEEAGEARRARQESRRRPRPRGRPREATCSRAALRRGRARAGAAARSGRAASTCTASSRRPSRPAVRRDRARRRARRRVHGALQGHRRGDSDTPTEVPDATRENVLAHERVNEAVMRSHTVIPMSFGTVFKTRDDIVELLRGAYEAFIDVLGKMEDKLEFGLKVLWDRDVDVREVEKDDEDVRRLKSEISSQKGSTYFARMQYGRLLDVGAADPLRALRQRDLRPAARRVRRLAGEQADRRPHDHERGVPRRPRQGGGVRRAGEGARRASTTSSRSSTRARGRPTTSSTSG